ncbi:MAG: hypothetical protein HOQ27_09400, partial [Dermatophilaceae bacterium]|nr:hypothetical protein [Dermatophilaceae bacterium]
MARVTAPPAVDTAAPSAGTPLRARLLAPPGAALDQPAPEVEPDPPDGPWHRIRRRLAAVPRWVWACVAVLVLVAAALTTYAVTRPPGPAP